MSGPYVIDTSVFIRVVHGHMPREVITRSLATGSAYLSSVVAHELWAGTRDRQDAADLAALLQSFEHINAVLTPTHMDWVAAGRLLTQYQRIFGPFAPRDHSHDVLIVLCAAQVHGTILTVNARHMERWARLARRAGRTVNVQTLGDARRRQP